jgi:6-phosphogluconate dehydrogenase
MEVIIIGLGVMGSNLAKNFASKGIKTNVFNRSYQKTQELIAQNISNITGFESLEDCINSVSNKRIVFLLVKSGNPTDEMIKTLKPLLKKGDILVDLGNSFYKDTDRRQKELEELGIDFIGCGISGGSKGALEGASFMPSGKKESVDELISVLNKVSASDFNNRPCVTYVGLGSSGHFVKMVHNGIEYALMQIISELYGFLLSSGYSRPEIIEIFRDINIGYNNSYLIAITIKILETIDPTTNKYLIDLITPTIGAKGTGRWSVEAALEYGVNIPTIGASVFARLMTQDTALDIRQYVSEEFINNASSGIEKPVDLAVVFEHCQLVSFLQGIDLIKKANEINNWGIDIQEILRIWQGGCIIRTMELARLYDRLNGEIDLYTDLWSVKKLIRESGIAMPACNSVVDYSLKLSTNTKEASLVQALRDFFGSHGYFRSDIAGEQSGGWNELA